MQGRDYPPPFQRMAHETQASLMIKVWRGGMQSPNFNTISRHVIQGLRRAKKVGGGANFDEILARLYREFKKIKYIP